MFCYISSAASSREAASVDATKTKQASTFKCWISFLLSIGITKSTSKVSLSSNRISYSQHLLKPCEMLLSLKEIDSSWWREQSTPPSHMWHSPSGQTIRTTPDWTAIIKLALSSKNNSEGIAIRMAQEESKKLYQ